MEMFERPILMLALAMILAIGIERMLEVFRAVRDYIESRAEDQDKWMKKTEQLRTRIEARLDNANGKGKSSFHAVLTVVCRYLSPAPEHAGGLMAISVDKVRSLSIKLRYKVAAILLGIGFAFLFQIDIFSLVEQYTKLQKEYEAPAILAPSILGMIVSGIAMGFGAGPVHKLITAMERARRFGK